MTVCRLQRAVCRYRAVFGFEIAAPHAVRRHRLRLRRRTRYHQKSAECPKLFQERSRQLAALKRVVEQIVRELVALFSAQIYIRRAEPFCVQRRMFFKQFVVRRFGNRGKAGFQVLPFLFPLTAYERLYYDPNSVRALYGNSLLRVHGLRTAVRTDMRDGAKLRSVVASRGKIHKVIFVFDVYAVGKFGDRIQCSCVELIVHIERKIDGYRLLPDFRNFVDQRIHFRHARNEKLTLVFRVAVFERNADFAVFHIQRSDVLFGSFVYRHFDVKIAKRQRICLSGMIALLHKRVGKYIFGVLERVLFHFLAHVFQLVGNVLQYADVPLPPEVAVIYHYHVVTRSAVYGRADNAVARGQSFAPSASPPACGTGELQKVFRFLYGCHNNLALSSYKKLFLALLYHIGKEIVYR